MSIFRIHKTQNFTVMSNYHFKERDMSLKAKGLLSLMLSLPDDWSYNVSGLVKLSKDGKDSVMSALSELEKFGYLKRVRTTDDKGRFSGVEYNIFEEPQQEIPIPEKQNEEKPNSVNSNSANPPLLNTNVNQRTNVIKNTNELRTKGIEEGYYEQFQDILEHIKDIELRNLYVDFVESRHNNGYPMTPRSLSMLINRAARITNFDVKLEKQILEEAIIQGWKNVYLPKEQPEAMIENDIITELKEFYGDEE